MSTTNQIDSKIKEILDVFKQTNMNFPTRGTCQNINSFSYFFATGNSRSATTNGTVFQEDARGSSSASTQEGNAIQGNGSHNCRLNISNNCLFFVVIGLALLVIATFFLVLIFKDICWYVFIFGIIFFPVLCLFVLLLLKFSFSYYLKLIALTENHEDRRIEFERRQTDRERDFQELTQRAEIDVYEKYEKAQIDEWIRDNDHIRKLELSQSERLSELGKLLFELSKIKNTITFKQGEKEIKIESSALSNIDLDRTRLFFEGLYFHMR